MSKINSYFVNEKDNLIKILIELLDEDNGSLSSFYYELILKVNGGNLDNRYYEIESVKEINNIIDYLFKNFKGNVKSRRLDDATNDYLIKMMNFQTYKKGFNERLVKRLMAYFETMEDTTRMRQ